MATASLFSPDLLGGLVVTKRDEFRVAEVIVAGPFKEFDLRDLSLLNILYVLSPLRLRTRD